MSDKDFDDGLVHAHGWATEPATPGSGRTSPAPDTADAADRQAGKSDHDDGLVHSHGWARN